MVSRKAVEGIQEKQRNKKKIQRKHGGGWSEFWRNKTDEAPT